MIILVLRSDKEEAELYVYDDHKRLANTKWRAHRQLAETLHQQISKILNKSSISLNDIQGVVCFKGPGSFTGLRIGLSVANALAYAQGIPIVARKGENWLKTGIKDLQTCKNDRIAIPFYGQPANTSAPKK